MLPRCLSPPCSGAWEPSNATGFITSSFPLRSGRPPRYRLVGGCLRMSRPPGPVLPPLWPIRSGCTCMPKVPAAASTRCRTPVPGPASGFKLLHDHLRKPRPEHPIRISLPLPRLGSRTIAAELCPTVVTGQIRPQIPAALACSLGFFSRYVPARTSPAPAAGRSCLTHRLAHQAHENRTGCMMGARLRLRIWSRSPESAQASG